MEISISLDETAYTRKPNKKSIIAINNRIPQEKRSLPLKEIAYLVGNKGHSFCPALFETRRCSKDFKEMQLLVLDFDSGISFEEIKERAKYYNLPLAFAYHTFSSSPQKEKFRVVFQNDVPITTGSIATIMIQMLFEIFQEADKSCKDVSRLFFGGKGLIDKVNHQLITIVGLTESFQRYVYETQPKNYARIIEKFAEKHQIVCRKSCLQIYPIDKKDNFEDFLESHPYIYGSESIFPSNSPKYIIFSHCYQTYAREKSSNPPTNFKVDFNTVKQKCQLYRDFLEKPQIDHAERFLLLTNFLSLSGGRKKFLSIIKQKGYTQKNGIFMRIIRKREAINHNLVKDIVNMQGNVIIKQI